jgi:hypothetical protein
MVEAVLNPTAPPGLAKTFGLITTGFAGRRQYGWPPTLRSGRRCCWFMPGSAAWSKGLPRWSPAPRPGRCGLPGRGRPRAGGCPHPMAFPAKARPANRSQDGPKNFAWLIRMLPYEAACFGSQLQHQFSQPEMMALLEAAPQVGRLLRPLCRMLAIELPPALRLPPRPPRPRKPRKPRPPKEPIAEQTPRAAPLTGRKPRRPPAVGEDGTVYEWRRWRGIWMPEPLKPA